MEKFYFVSNDCKVGQDYLAYKEAEKKIVKAFDDFATKKGIKATKFHPSDSLLWIVPTDDDITKFGNEFTKSEQGKFKKSSATNKAWVAKCADEGIKYIEKPFVPFIFNYTGRSQFRLFDVDDKIYCTFDCPIDLETPEGFVQMKGSEFYTIMESYHIEL